MCVQAAVSQFELLFSDEKARGNKEKWKDYFLSETFLDVQFSQEYTGQVQEFLKTQEFVPYDGLPPYFLYELMVAYGMEPFISEADACINAAFMDKAHYESDMPHGLYDMQVCLKKVAEIWNAQDKSWRRERGGRSIRKWEYRLRCRAFEDYIQICMEYECGDCKWEKDEYCEGPPARGQWCYIQSGRCKQTEYGTFTRNECILKLYEYFLRTRKVPLPSCVWLWQTYDFAGMKGKRYAEKYEGIRRALTAQHPEIETFALKDSDEKEKIRKWFVRLYDLEKKYRFDGWQIKPIMPYYYTYATSVPTVTDEEKKELESIISDAVFEKNKFDYSFIDDLECHWCGGNATLGMTEAFLDAYMESGRVGTVDYSECGKNTEDYSENGSENTKLTTLLEYMKSRLSYFGRIPEYMCYEPYKYDLSMDSSEFWYYYLMKAFEGWYTEVNISDDSFIEHNMIEDGRKYLSGYIEQLYQPSMEWRRRFTGSDKSGRIAKPKSMDVEVLMELVITIEFHLHYIRFYVDGEPCIGEVFSFQELLKYAGNEGQEKRFVLLLALTHIETEERNEAYREIRKRLEKLPIDGFCLDFVAKCLSDGKVLREVSSSDVIYMENLKTCYCAEIHSSGIVIAKNTPRGWRLEDPWFSTDSTEKEIRNLALYGLSGICQTKTERKRIAVAGMPNIEKAEKIVELLKENKGSAGSHCRDIKMQQSRFKQNDIFMEDFGFYGKLPKAVKLFMRENSFLTCNSITLVYGNQDSCYFEKALDTGIFGADEGAEDEWDVTRKEKTYRTYWMSQDWNLQKTIFYVGESGTIWYYKSFSKLAKSESIEEVIAECYQLKDVTAVYISC